MDEIKKDIMNSLEKGEHRSYMYLEQHRSTTLIKGYYSSHDALKFVKMIITQRPEIYAEVKAWGGPKS